MPEIPPLQDIPEAIALPRRRAPLPLVWIVPIVAALIGGWIAIHAVMQRGPTVTISFLTAEGWSRAKPASAIKTWTSAR
ncbi:hypothetical protein [Methylogaea oryzae]|uniref:hypothetical protein n=1 Tax=Methylogaea oryzae TaxID=1295382 RepID=UPI0020D08939|nr:hypothetical protein [Methylogaea oryzae]